MRFALAALALAASAFAQPASTDPRIERGRYLVEEIAKCQDCHSPHLDSGEFDKSRWLKGAVLDIAPLKPVQGWHKTSPNLTPDGTLWKKWGEEALVKYMTTGLGPRGTPADPPMPAYKLKPEDAEAVVAFLKSLP